MGVGCVGRDVEGCDDLCGCGRGRCESESLLAARSLAQIFCVLCLTGECRCAPRVPNDRGSRRGVGERCNSTSSVRTHDCVDCSSLAKEDRARSSEDRKIAQEGPVRKHDAFKFVQGRSPTPLLLPLSQLLKTCTHRRISPAPVGGEARSRSPAAVSRSHTHAPHPQWARTATNGGTGNQNGQSGGHLQTRGSRSSSDEATSKQSLLR